MIKIAFMGICVVMLALPLQQWKQEYSMLLGLLGCGIIFFSMVGKMQDIFQVWSALADKMPVSSLYIRLLLKMLAISYVTEFSQDICKEAGYQALATQIGMAGRITLLAMSLPIAKELFYCLESWWS